MLILSSFWSLPSKLAAKESPHQLVFPAILRSAILKAGKGAPVREAREKPTVWYTEYERSGGTICVCGGGYMNFPPHVRKLLDEMRHAEIRRVWWKSHRSELADYTDFSLNQ